jgi:hypothetical protein
VGADRLVEHCTCEEVTHLAGFESERRGLIFIMGDLLATKCGLQMWLLAFWVPTVCGLTGTNQRFGGKYYTEYGT